MASTKAVWAASGTAVSDFKDAATRESERAHLQLIQSLNEGKRAFFEQEARLRAARAAHDAAEESVTRAAARVTELQAELQNAQNSGGAAAVRLMRCEALSSALSAAQGVLSEQRASLRGVEASLNHAEHDVIEAEVSLSRMKDALAAAEASAAARSERQQRVAASRVAREKRVGGVIAAGAAAAEDAALARDRASAASDAAALDASRVLRMTAVRGDVSDTSMQQQLVAAAGEYHAHKSLGRVDALLALRASVAGVESTAAAAHARREEAAAQKEAARAAEAAALLADRVNPHEVFRARERDAALAATQEAHARAVEAAKASLTQRVIAEEEQKRGLEAVRAHSVEAARGHRAALSRPVREARTSAFVMAHTLGGQEVLDPSGRSFRTAPSAVTLVKHAAFGTGLAHTHADAHAHLHVEEIVARIAAKPSNAGVEPVRVMVPKSLRDPDAQQEDGGVSALDDEEAMVTTHAALRAEAPGALPASGSISNAPTAPRTRTTYELRMLADARQRQRDGIVQTQVVGGTVYAGDGFLPAPSQLTFTDFEVGVPMTTTLTLTNISLSFNSFRLLPLEDAFRDLFVIKFTPAGRMSAGTSNTITVTFTPRVNSDIHTTLTVLCHTGPLSVPVHATIKKALPRVDASSLDIGDVTLGEARTSLWCVYNDGALPFTVEVGDEAEAPLSFPSTVDVSPYSSVRIPFRFTPIAEGAHRSDFSVRFRAEGVNVGEVVQLSVAANAVPVPLYLLSDVLDFHTCVRDKLYRATLRVLNRGTVALRCAPVLPPGLEGVLSITPASAYVQAMHSRTGEPGEFPFSVKFRPNAALVASTTFSTSITQGGVTLANVSIPCSIVAPDQVLPVPFNVAADVTGGDVQIQPAGLSFGPCIVGQAVARNLTLRNTSAVPIQFAFIQLPPCFSVAPGDGTGFGVLLPGEASTVEVVFSPTAAMTYSATLTCATTLAQEVRVHVDGDGLAPLLTLSHASLVLASTAVGETESAAISVTNASNESVTYECMPARFARERGSHTHVRADLLTASPCVGTLLPGASQRILLTLTPTVEDVPNAEAAVATPHMEAKEASDGKRSSALSTPPGDVDAYGAVHCDWYLPIAACVSRTSSAGGAIVSGISIVSTLMPCILSATPTVVAFAQVPVGQSATRSVRVRNSSGIPVRAFSTVSDATGAFTIVTPARILEPLSYDDIALVFAPAAHKHYAERLIIGGDGHTPRVVVLITGQGVAPTVSVDPLDAVNMDFGPVLVGDVASRRFAIRNTSSFPVEVMLRRMDDAASFEMPSSLQTFTCEPTECKLAAGGSASFVAVFNPRFVPRLGRSIHAQFLVDVPNQTADAVNVLTFTGKCFSTPFFLQPPPTAVRKALAAPRALDSALALPPRAKVSDAAAFSATAMGAAAGSPRASSASPPAPTPPSAAVIAAAGVLQAEDDGEVYELMFDTPAAAASAEVADAPVPGTRGKSAAPSGRSPASTIASSQHDVVVCCMARDASCVSLEVLFPAVPASALVPPPLVPPLASAAPVTAPGKAGATGAKAAAATPAAASKHGTGTPAIAGSLAVPCSFQVALPPAITATSASPQHYFSVEPASGSVAPGARATVSFRFTPPAGALSAPITQAGASSHGQHQAVQVAAPRDVVIPGAWSTVDARITLTSNVPSAFIYALSNASGQAGTLSRSYIVRLKAFVPAVSAGGAAAAST